MLKFTTWQLVAILAIVFAAVICSQIFIPGTAAYATVATMAAGIFGTLFVQRYDGEKEEKK